MPKFRKINIIRDGNCLFRAASKFLFNSENLHSKLREDSVKYINKNWNTFASFLGDDVSREKYCKKMLRNGEYGTAFECLAMSELFSTNFNTYLTNLNSTHEQNSILNMNDQPIKISKSNYRETIDLLFSGNPDAGHFDLLIPVNEESQESYCSTCVKHFKNMNGLKIHNSKIHKKANTTIQDSGLSQNPFSNMDSQKKISFTSLDQMYPTESKCQICEKIFNNSKGMKQHMTKKHKGVLHTENKTSKCNAFDSITLNSFLSKLKSSTPVIKRIPKNARGTVAEELTALLKHCMLKNDVEAWCHLLFFVYGTLKVPDRKRGNRKVSLTSSIKKNVTDWKKIKNLPYINFLETFKSTDTKPKSSVNETTTKTLSRKIQSKISDCDIRGAIRLLSSDDKLAPKNEDTLLKLQEKHPDHDRVQNFEEFKEQEFSSCSFFSSSDVKNRIISFRPGSAGGLDSLRPQHLKDLIAEDIGIYSLNLLNIITDFANFILYNSIPELIVPIFYGASLCALNKKGGGIRPIAMGLCWRRLAAKLICSSIYDLLGSFLRPFQLGFGTKNGSESITHAIRRYLSFSHNSPKIVLKIDFCNAFNMINRSTILSRTNQYIPEFQNFIFQSYSNKSILSFGDHILYSQRGVQQGDPLGPALFCLAIQPIVMNLKSEINTWYLDDGTLAGDPSSVFKDFAYLITSCSEIGLSINYQKCEFAFISNPTSTPLNNFPNYIPLIESVSKINPLSLNLLGCPFDDEEIKSSFIKKNAFMHKMAENLSIIEPHTAYFLLRHSFAVPRLTYMLRCAPCWRVPDCLVQFDDIVRECLENISNCKFEDQAWRQSCLPVSLGGLGIRDTTTLCFSAFLGCLNDVLPILPSILPSYIFSTVDAAQQEATEFYKNISLSTEISDLKHQKDFDLNMCKSFVSNMLSNSETPEDKARLLALQEFESSAWLRALPSTSLGNLLDAPSFRISVALRLGVSVCEPHNCTCGKTVDSKGLHGLSCNKSAGRLARHGQINDIIKRSLVAAGIPAVLEPPGVCRGDGKRVDGMTLIPWKKGRALLWDATCRDTVAFSYIDKTSVKAGEAARGGEIVKSQKYKELEDRFLFCPFSVETFGPWGVEAKRLIREISLKIPKEGALGFITQRISIAIQRGNASSILGTIPADHGLDEILVF